MLFNLNAGASDEVMEYLDQDRRLLCAWFFQWRRWNQSLRTQRRENVTEEKVKTGTWRDVSGSFTFTASIFPSFALLGISYVRPGIATCYCAQLLPYNITATLSFTIWSSLLADAICAASYRDPVAGASKVEIVSSPAGFCLLPFPFCYSSIAFLIVFSNEKCVFIL